MNERMTHAEKMRAIDKDLLKKATEKARNEFTAGCGVFFDKNGYLTERQRNALQNIIDNWRPDHGKINR